MQLGLTVLGLDTVQFRCDAPTQTGRLVGLALRGWVAPTRYYQDYFNSSDRPVPAADVAEYAERICLCRLTEGPDHPLLQDAFLHGGEPAEAERRRASLRLVCDLSAQTAAEAVRSRAFRQLVYYRSDDDGRTYEPSHADLVATVRRWRLYQHRELVAWAYNRWLRRISEWGLNAGGDGAPISLADVLATADDADFATLATALGVADPRLTARQPLSSLLDWVRAAGRVGGDLDAPWDLTAPVCEDRVVDTLWDLRQSGDDTTAAVLALLALCAARLWPLEYQLRYADDWGLVRAGGARRLAVDRFLDDMRRHARTGATIGETGRWFLEQYVVRQHHRVALAKLPDDTFRLCLDAGRVRFVNESVAVEMNDSRYRALSTSAAELGWTKPMGNSGHVLSPTGRRLVTTGDLPRLQPPVADP